MNTEAATPAPPGPDTRTEVEVLRDEVARLTAALETELSEHRAGAHWCLGYGNTWLGSDQREHGDCRVRRRLLAVLQPQNGTGQ